MSIAANTWRHARNITALKHVAVADGRVRNVKVRAMRRRQSAPSKRIKVHSIAPSHAVQRIPCHMCALRLRSMLLIELALFDAKFRAARPELNIEADRRCTVRMCRAVPSNRA